MIGTYFSRWLFPQLLKLPFLIVSLAIVVIRIVVVANLFNLRRCTMYTCRDCVRGRPNSSCSLLKSTEKQICDMFELDSFDETCNCGWWTCGSRGCGSCPDCYGYVCVC